MGKKLIFLIAFLFFLFKTASAYTISGCSAISSPGEYYLTQNIINAQIIGSSACIDIQANNVLLDCQNYYVDGIDDGIGIKIIRTSYQSANATIRNCRVSDFYYGIKVEEARNVSILNCEFTSNYWYGIYFNDEAHNTTVLNTKVSEGNYYGIGYFWSNYGNFTNNSILNNGFVGVYFDDSSYNFFYNNTVAGHPEEGIRAYTDNSVFAFNRIFGNSAEGIYVSGNSNLIFNNFFNNSANAGVSGANFWNTTRQAGTRIFTNGTEIGGNFWATPSGNGFSQTCNDTNQDGFCDDSYAISSGNIDYLPYSLYYAPPPPPPPYCMLINQSGTYYLTEDIINSEVDECIIINASNVVLDCQSHYVDGIGKEYSAGIEILKPNAIVRNCKIRDWHFGFSIMEGNAQLSNNILENLALGIAFHTNSNLEANGLYGYSIGSAINSWAGSHALIKNCYLEGTGEDSGISLLEAYNWTIENCSISGFVFGIEIHESENITIFNISSFNNQIGVGIEARNATLSNSTIYENSAYGLYLGGTESFYSWNVLIYNNLFNNTYNHLINQFSYSTDYPNGFLACKFNTTKTEGTNIIGNPYLGGNVWSTPSGDGYSDTCNDEDNDGICDSAYTLWSYSGYNWIDYLPLKSGAVALCQRFPPEANIIPSSKTVQRLQTANYTLRIKNNNTAYCSPSVFYIESIECPSGGCVVCTEYGCHPPVYPRIYTEEISPQEVKYYPINVTPQASGTFNFTYRIYDSSTWYYSDARATIVSTPIPCQPSPPSFEWGDPAFRPQNRTRLYSPNCGWAKIWNNDYGDTCTERNFTISQLCPYNLECTPSQKNFSVSPGSFEWVQLCAVPNSIQNFTMKFKAYDPETQASRFLEWNFSVSPCAILYDKKQYILNSDAVADFSPCIEIDTHGAYIDCKGYSIKDLSMAGSTGILTGGPYENWTIKNCKIENFTTAININGRGKLENLRLIGKNINEGSGIRAYGVFNSSLDSLKISNFEYGIFLLGSEYNEIKNSEIANCGSGILFDGGSSDNSITKIKILNSTYGFNFLWGLRNLIFENRVENSYVGLRLFSTGILKVAYNKIFSNEFVKSNLVVASGATANFVYQNTFVSLAPPQAGDTANFYDYQNRGNYWGMVGGTGYSDTCEDRNFDGICDYPYIINEQNIDNYPISKFKPARAVACEVCNPLEMGIWGIVCILVNILVCFPILIIMLVLIFAGYAFWKKYKY